MNKALLLSILLISLCFSAETMAALQGLVWPDDILYYLAFDFICLILMLAMIVLFKMIISESKKSH
jgi:hypothetical protein